MVLHDGGCSMAYLRANTACIFFGPRARCGRGLRGDEWLDRFVGALRRVVRPVAAPLQAPQTECGGALQMFGASPDFSGAFPVKLQSWSIPIISLLYR